MHRTPTLGDVLKLPAYRNAEWIVCGVDKSILHLLDDASLTKKTITVDSNATSGEYIPLTDVGLIDSVKRSLAAKLWNTHYG